MDLPLELRNMVYKAAFNSHRTMVEEDERCLRADYDEKFRCLVRENHCIMALLWTSWRIHQEIREILQAVPKIYLEFYEVGDNVRQRKWFDRHTPLRGLGASAFGMQDIQYPGSGRPNIYDLCPGTIAPKVFVVEQSDRGPEELILAFSFFTKHERQYMLRMQALKDWKAGRLVPGRGERVRDVRQFSTYW